MPALETCPVCGSIGFHAQTCPRRRMKTTGDYVHDPTQIGRDRVIQWLLDNRPSVLREALRACGYIRR
jgi:hypothetical protein